MHGEKWAWSLLRCTCELIMLLLKRERKTPTPRVERLRVAQKFKRRCRGARRARSLLAPGQRHYWIILKWVDYHRFQTTCDSSQRDSLICKNFIYAWHALITKGVCAFNSPQRDACNVCQDGRVKTSRPLAQAHKRLRDARPFHTLRHRLGSTWDLSLLGNSLLFQNGQFQIWVTGIKHPSIHPSPVILLSGWQGGGVNSSWLYPKQLVRRQTQADDQPEQNFHLWRIYRSPLTQPAYHFTVGPSWTHDHSGVTNHCTNVSALL